jgi:hypothetical protein
MIQSRRKFLKVTSIAGIGTIGAIEFLSTCTRLLVNKKYFSKHLNDLVQCAFRITDQYSLLNLEYYFINCSFNPSESKITALYGPHENYMVVKLPQQHMAEQNFAEEDKGEFKAATYISGFSYLVFRILFAKEQGIDNDKDKALKKRKSENTDIIVIELSLNNLLKWDDEKLFRLVVRQDLTESLFELEKPDYYNYPLPAKDSTLFTTIGKSRTNKLYKAKQDSFNRANIQNYYPFQQKDSEDSLKINLKKSHYDRNRLPKVYGDPVTAIEIPWRLIISPRIPDSKRFKFHWHFIETDIDQTATEISTNTKRHKLWTVTLSIVERKDLDYIAWKKNEDKNDDENKLSSTGSLSGIINQLELMMLGSPDYPIPKYLSDEFLPTGSHRKDLVSLYIKLKVMARSDKFTFSPLGSTAQIHLKNDKIENAFKQNPPIGLIEWDHIISLGRDEKVQVATLFLEAEFGHKMAYIQIAERKLKKGYYPLILKAFIMPLDIDKDYTSHITQNIKNIDSKGNNKDDDIVSRFKSPFKKISFIETQPKELIMPIDKAGNKIKYLQYELNPTLTSFEFEAIDWHGNKIKFLKKINALPFGSVVDLNKKDDKGNRELNDDIIKILTDTLTYQKQESFKQIPDSINIPFYSTRHIDSAIFKKNDASIQIEALNDSIEMQQTLKMKLQAQITSIYVDLGEEIAETNKDRFEEYFELLKAKYENIYKRSSDSLHIIIQSVGNEALNFETFVHAILNKYLLSKELLNKSIEIILLQWFDSVKTILSSRENLLIWLKQYESLKDDELYIYLNKNYKTDIKKVVDNLQYSKDQKILHEALDKILGNKEKLKEFEEQYNFHIRNTHDENIDKLFQWIISFTNSGIDYKHSTLFNTILLNSPEFARIIEELILIHSKFQHADEIFKIIKSRLINFYDLQIIGNQIPNLILLQRQKIGYALKEKYDDVRQKLIKDFEEKTGQLKKSLSELESEYLIFKGALRQADNKIFDFFHEYAIIPQLQQAKIYVSTINKLVQEEFPISIEYPFEYLQNQARETEFEIKQNASMVFAKVQQDSREQLKGLIQKIGDKMPGFNVELPIHNLTYLRNPKEVETSILKEIGYASEQIEIVKDFSKDLVFISDEVKEGIKTIEDLESVDPKKYFRDLGAKLFGSISLEDILGIGFDLPRITELPDRIIYQFSNERFQEHRASFVVFRPNTTSRKGSSATKLDLFVSKSLKNKNEYYAYTKLNDFSVGVIIGGTDVLTVTFNEFIITSTPKLPKKTDISIGDVKLGGPLEFIADLAKNFMTPGNGMRIKPGPRNLQLDYNITLPDILAPAFNFKNLQFNIGINIPYDPASLRPISFTFGVNKPEDKFLISAGIYGGRGHFLLRATPKGIDLIDVAIELGAYATIDLRIGKGEVFMFFGFWFVSGKNEAGENLIKAVAYVICSGSATVLGFISIGVSVLIALTYVKQGQTALFYGEAVVTYSVKVAFFKKEFSIHYYKEIEGSGNGNGTTSTPTVGMILLDAAMPGSTYAGNKRIKERVSFTDVFNDAYALKDYFDCFIKS